MADDEARIVSVIGGARRTNRWRVAPDTSVLTLFGRCLIDLRRAETDAEEIWFGITSVFAAVEIIVPDGTVVQPSGIAFLAGSSCVVPDSTKDSPLPDIEVVATTVLGKLDIHTGDPRPRRGPIRWLLRRPPKAVAVVADDLDPTAPVLPIDEPGVDLLAGLAPSATSPDLGDDLAEIDSMIETAVGTADVLGTTSAADSDITPGQDTEPTVDTPSPALDGDQVEATSA